MIRNSNFPIERAGLNIHIYPSREPRVINFSPLEFTAVHLAI